MKKTLYIHAGTPKTGTSALQMFLGLNEKRLYENGMIYRTFPFHDYLWEIPNVDDPNGIRYHTYASGPSSKTHNARFLYGSHLPEKEEQNKKDLQQGFALLKEWFREKDRILLSDEGLWKNINAWPAAVKAFAEENEISVKIVVYLRRQLEYLESLYKQETKLFLFRMSFSEFAANPLLNESYFGLDYEKMLAALAGSFGKENLIVRVYDMKQWKQKGISIYQDFMEALDLPYSDKFQIPEQNLNPSLTFDQTEIYRVQNRVLDVADRFTEKYNKRVRNIAYECADAVPDRERYSYLSEEERRAFMERFRSSNEAVAREYFGRETLFSEDYSGKVRWENDPFRITEDISIYYNGVLRFLYERLETQRKSHDETKKHCWGYRLRGRHRSENENRKLTLTEETFGCKSVSEKHENVRRSQEDCLLYFYEGYFQLYGEILAMKRENTEIKRCSLGFFIQRLKSRRKHPV